MFDYVEKERCEAYDLTYQLAHDLFYKYYPKSETKKTDSFVDALTVSIFNLLALDQLAYRAFPHRFGHIIAREEHDKIDYILRRMIEETRLLTRHKYAAMEIAESAIDLATEKINQDYPDFVYRFRNHKLTEVKHYEYTR